MIRSLNLIANHFFENFKPSEKITNKMINVMIDKLLTINFEEDYYSVDKYLFPLLAIAINTKSNFEIIDSRFHEFGKIYYESMMKFEENDKHAFQFHGLIFDSFSELVIKNLVFSKTEILPHLDLQNIQSKLQFYLLTKNCYFNLLPDVLAKFSDIQFNFK